MSYVPEFAPDAQSQWRELEVELQEVVLDELEILLANPPPPPKDSFYHDARYLNEKGETTCSFVSTSIAPAS